jgi:uncharacterized protein (DUF302 family)
MKHAMLFLSLLVFITSCTSNDDPGDVVLNAEELNITGTRYSLSDNNFNATYTGLLEALNANEDIGIVAEVDHAANARAVGRVLNPTKIVFFGNPSLGTPLMQKNQLAGLDLPQRIMVFEDSDSQVFAMYNSVVYLESRFGLQGVEQLSQISGALENLTKSVTNSEVSRSSTITVPEGDGIISVKSVNDFNTTYNTLINSIENNENLQVVAELDHQANAASVNMELRPTKLVIFGNPKLGSPLIQNSQTAGLDLPQKMLVWEDENGQVNISYNDSYYLRDRHDITNNQNELEQIATVLENLAKSASGN